MAKSQGASIHPETQAQVDGVHTAELQCSRLKVCKANQWTFAGQKK